MDVTPDDGQDLTRNYHKVELERYLPDPLIHKSEAPLLQWKRNEEYYSNLLPIVLKYLSAPPSSIHSERLFSTAVNVFEEKRSSLRPENGVINCFYTKESFII